MKFSETDFLENLRNLNCENINELPEIRDAFFNSLMVYSEQSPSYLKVLSDAYSKDMGKPYEGSPVKTFVLSKIFGNEIRNQLTDGIIEDKTSCLYTSERCAKHAVTYIGSIKGTKEIVCENATHFNFFKQSILQGLIVRYCHNYASGLNRDTTRLNQLINIYVEHIRRKGLYDSIDTIIDEEFLNGLTSSRNNGTLSQKEIFAIINKLINRKFPIENHSYYDDYSHHYRRI